MISILTSREAATARRVWRDRWLADVAAKTRADSELEARLQSSLHVRARQQDDRWWRDR